MFRPSGLPKALQVLALLGLLAPPASSTALAQSEIATYQGPDRTQRLIAGHDPSALCTSQQAKP